MKPPHMCSSSRIGRPVRLLAMALLEDRPNGPVRPAGRLPAALPVPRYSGMDAPHSRNSFETRPPRSDSTRGDFVRALLMNTAAATTAGVLAAVVWLVGCKEDPVGVLDAAPELELEVNYNQRNYADSILGRLISWSFPDCLRAGAASRVSINGHPGKALGTGGEFGGFECVDVELEFDVDVAKIVESGSMTVEYRDKSGTASATFEDLFARSPKAVRCTGFGGCTLLIYAEPATASTTSGTSTINGNRVDAP